MRMHPDEVYDLGAQSHVVASFGMPEYTVEVNVLGTVRLPDRIRDLGLTTRFNQASTSELYGSTPETLPQSEMTLVTPRSPSAAAELYASWITANYREGYGLFACNGILFNHESPRRGETFVTKKTTKVVANICRRRQKTLRLGTLDAKGDWWMREGIRRGNQAHAPAAIPAGSWHCYLENAQ